MEEGLAARALGELDQEAIRQELIEKLSRGAQSQRSPAGPPREPGKLSGRELEDIASELAERERSAFDELRILRAQLDIVRTELDARRRRGD